MELVYAPTSPYARKARILIQELGLSDTVTLKEANPIGDPASVRPMNPLGLVPILFKDDGEFLPDSPVILDYLIEQTPDNTLPVFETREAYWKDRRLHAICDGLLDVSVKRTQENRRPESEQSPDWKERWTLNIMGTLKYLEDNPDLLDGPFHLGQIALVCTLDYVAFRHPDLNWTDHCPNLSAWMNKMADRSSLKSTRPE